MELSKALPMKSDQTKREKCMSILKKLIPIIITLTGTILEGSSMPYWIKAFTKGGGPYFILLFVAVVVVILLSTCILIIKCVKNVKTAPLKKYTKDYILQGLSNCLFGICYVYASPIERTPPVFFLTISNLSIIFSIPLTKIFIKSKKLKYCSVYPLLSLTCLFSAIILMLIAKILYETDVKIFNWMNIFWIGIVILSTFFATLHNTLQEKYLIESNKDLNDFEIIFNYIYTGMWAMIYQLLFIILFWAIDIIPSFGFSNISTFITNISDSFLCYIGNGCSYENTLYGTLFVVGYMMTYIGSAFLNAESSSFVMYLSTIQTPAVATIFLIVGVGVESTPIWAVVPSIILIVTGMILWKYWENGIRHITKRINMLQYDVRPNSLQKDIPLQTFV